MTRRVTTSIMALLVSIMVLTHPVAAADDSPHERSSPLWLALAYAPPGTTLLTVTDWDALKAAHGIEIVDSSLPEMLRIEGMNQLTEDEAVFSGFGLSRFLGHADAWGWDASDLAWDAQILASGAPLHVLRFRDDLDLDPFIDRLDAHGFDRRQRGDVTIRHHDLDIGQEWVTTTELAIHNTAFLPDGRTLLMSSSAEALEAALATLAASDVTALRASPAGEVAAALGEPASAVIEIGSDRCVAHSRVPDDDPNASLLAEVGPLSRWEALGVGTSVGAGEPSTARLVLLADDAATAQEEAEGRARLLREGVSSLAGERFADVAFTVTNAGSDGAIIRIDLLPLDGRSRMVARALFTADLPAARCDPV